MDTNTNELSITQKTLLKILSCQINDKKYVPQPVRDFIEKRESEATQVPAGKKAKQRKGVATGEAVCGVPAEG